MDIGFFIILALAFGFLRKLRGASDDAHVSRARNAATDQFDDSESFGSSAPLPKQGYEPSEVDSTLYFAENHIPGVVSHYSPDWD